MQIWARNFSILTLFTAIAADLNLACAWPCDIRNVELLPCFDFRSGGILNAFVAWNLVVGQASFPAPKRGITKRCTRSRQCIFVWLVAMKWYDGVRLSSLRFLVGVVNRRLGDLGRYPAQSNVSI